MNPANDYVRQATARGANTSNRANPRPHRGVKSLAVSGVDRVPSKIFVCGKLGRGGMGTRGYQTITGERSD